MARRYRKPSLNKRIAARTSVKRYLRHNLGFKAPRGCGWVTDPKRAAYNRAYNRRTKSGCLLPIAVVLMTPLVAGLSPLLFGAS